MGVRGLTSYVMGCQWSCSEHVELSAGGVANSSSERCPRETHAAGDRAGCDHNRAVCWARHVVHTLIWDDGERAEGSVLLAVDGSALIYHVMQNPGEHELHLDLGCDYLALRDALLDYLSDLTRAGITPVVVVDGMQDCQKEATTLERRRTQALEASALMEDISPDRNDQDSRPDPPSSQFASLLPLFATEALAAACGIAGVACRAAEREADPELAALCHPAPRPKNACLTRPKPANRSKPEGLDDEPHSPNSAEPGDSKKSGDKESRGAEESGPLPKKAGPPQGGVGLAGDHQGGAFRNPGSGEEGARRARGCCDVVVSNDSDFLVMDVPGYIPFWSLAVGEDGSAGALVFRRSMVAATAPNLPPHYARRHPPARLGIPPDRMPDLACLVGNDWIEPDGRVHRIIVDEANGKTNTNSNTKKKRKGATTTSRNGTRSAAPPRARDLVEATGRYLSRFYGDNPPAGTRKDGDGDGDDDGDEDEEDTLRLLCTRFFPSLGDAGRSVRSGVMSRYAVVEKQAAASTASPAVSAACHFAAGGGGGGGGDGVAVAVGDAGADGATAAVADAYADADVVVAERFVEACCTTGETVADAVDQSRSHAASTTPPSKSTGRGTKGKKSKGRSQRGAGSSSSRKGLGGGERAGGENGVHRDGDDAVGVEEDYRAHTSEASTGRGVGPGETFLKDFRAAKLHYQTPNEISGDVDGRTVSRSDPPVEDATEGFSGVGSSQRGLLLSRVGLRAGISAPPELAQAVLEGVFWCRVMLEDGDDTRGNPPSRAARPPTPPPLLLLPQYPGGSSTSNPSAAAAAARPPVDCSSAFGRLSALRKNLYELCLAILVGGNSSSADVDSEAAFNVKATHEAGSGGGTTAGPDQFYGGVFVPGPGADGIGAREKARPLREGDGWVVKEFRRVGESVKPVQVFCQVPPPLRLSPIGTDDSLAGFGGVDGLRWKTCLSVLGLLGERHNRLLVDLVLSEVSTTTAMRGADRYEDEIVQSQATKKQAAAACCGGATNDLASVALVAAVLLNDISANTPPTSSTPARGGGGGGTFATSTHPNPGGQQRRCCLERIAFAFVAAATRCVHPSCQLALHGSPCCARDDPLRNQSTAHEERNGGGGSDHPLSPGNPSVVTHPGRGGGRGCCHSPPGNPCVSTHQEREGGRGLGHPLSLGNPSDLACHNSGQDHVDCSRCVGSAIGCRLEATCHNAACGCTCTLQPGGGLDTGETVQPGGGLDTGGEKDMYGSRWQEAAACAPASGLRKQKRAGKGQGPRSGSSAVPVQDYCESDRPYLREKNTSPGGVASPGGISEGGSYSVGGARDDPSCERCAAAAAAAAEVGVTEGQVNTVNRSFVNLWSEVQCAVWHVNACLGVLGLAEGRSRASGGGGGGGGCGVTLDPMRLHPALALERFKGNTPRLVGSSRHPADNNDASGVVGQQQAASPTAWKGVNAPQQGGSQRAAPAAAATTESIGKMAKRQTHGTAPQWGSQAAPIATAAAESAVQMANRRRHGGGTARGREHLGRDEKQQSERRLYGGCKGARGWEKLGRCDEKEHGMLPPGKQCEAVSTSRGAAEGCTGDCQWARRVRTVLEAAGSVYSR